MLVIGSRPQFVCWSAGLSIHFSAIRPLQFANLGRGLRTWKEQSMKTIGAVNDLVRFALSSLRKREREIEKVIEILRPGPLGIVEHKFSDGELADARLVAARALERWREAAAKRS